MSAEDDAAASVVDGDTVLPLVGEQRHDQLRPAVRGSAEDRAGAAVGDDCTRPAEQIALWDEALDADVGRDGAERRRVDVWPDGGDGVDVDGAHHGEQFGSTER